MRQQTPVILTIVVGYFNNLRFKFLIRASTYPNCAELTWPYVSYTSFVQGIKIFPKSLPLGQHGLSHLGREWVSHGKEAAVSTLRDPTNQARETHPC